MFKKAVLISILLSGLFYLASCGLDDNTVAKVGSLKITKTDFTKMLQRRFPGKTDFTTVDSAAKHMELQRAINQLQKVNAAYDLGLDKQESFISEMRVQRGRAIGNKYFERMIVDKLFPEEALKAQFEKQKEEVKASHILIAYKGARGSRVNRTKEDALKLAQKVAAEAKSGKSFAYLAEKYSDDPSVKSNKGEMGYFTWGRMVGPFQEAAFRMKPGEISDPVETSYGFHIIKVEDRRPNPQFNEKGFEAHKMEIKRNLYYTQKDSAIKMWNKLTKNLKKEYNQQLDEEGIAKVVQLAKEKQKSGKFKPADYLADEKSIVLARWNGGQLTLNDLFQIYYGRRFDYLRRKLTNKKALHTDVDRMVSQELMIKDAEKRGIADDPQVKAELKAAANQNLASAAYKAEVLNKAKVTEDEIKKFYNDNPKDFTQPAEIEIWEIYVKDKKKADKIAKLAKSGRNFEKLAQKYTEDNFYKKKKGYVGFRAENRRGAVSKEAFKIGVNKIGGPVHYRSGWAVIKTGTMHPETIRSYEKAHAQARTRLRNKKIKELRDAWEKSLKDKYPAKINEKLVEAI